MSRQGKYYIPTCIYHPYIISYRETEFIYGIRKAGHGLKAYGWLPSTAKADKIRSLNENRAW
jgi:hypothetical protein